MAKKLSEENTDRQITGISISTKGKVKIDFATITTISPVEGEEESTVQTDEYSIKTQRRPHRDLLEAMKKLRKHGLDICEMIFESKAIAFYNVSGIKIAGDLFLHKSRVVLTLSKEVKRTGKTIKWNTPQVTMYGESEYEKAEEMSKLIEVVIAEAWLFLEGKSESESQLPLFPKIELATS